MCAYRTLLAPRSHELNLIVCRFAGWLKPCVTVLVILIVVACDGAVNASANDISHAAQDNCASIFSWPIHGDIKIVRGFEAPEKPWLAGHRGVDISAHASETLYAPADGRISFSGKVAGKDVVSITDTHGWKNTFEPAVTDLKIGTVVRRGKPFGHVSSGKSDHCADNCVQWGIKVGKKEYLNPEKLARKARIMLKE